MAIYRVPHVPPFINGRGPTLYLFRCSTTSTQTNDTRPTERPVTGMLRGNRPRNEGFGLSENHGKNVGKNTMGLVVSFLWIFEGILWLFCLFCLSHPWDFRSLNFVLSMDLKFCGPDLCFLIRFVWFVFTLFERRSTSKALKVSCVTLSKTSMLP